MHDAAAEHFRLAIDASPANATYHGSLGLVLADQGQHEEAAACFRAAIKYDPGYHDAYLGLGRSLVELGQPEAALDLCHEALEIVPNSADAYYLMGNALQELGELQDAAGEYRQALYHRPDFPECRYNLAVALGKLGQHEQALSEYEQSARSKSSYATWHNLATTQARLGQTQAAVQSFQQALELRPDSPESLLGLGMLLNRASRHADAAQLLERARSLGANSADLDLELGNAYLGLGRAAEAQTCFQALLQARPDDEHARTGLADVLLALGHYEQAAAAYRSLLAERPNDTALLLNLGIVLARQGQIDEAIATYRQALAINPQMTEALCNLGVTWARLGDHPAAVEAFRQALQIDADHVPALNALAKSLAMLSREDEAVQVASRALELAPNFAQAYNTLGLALARQGSFAEAERAFARALQLNPRYVDVLNNRAAALKDQARLDEALEDFEEALRIEPRFATIQSNYLMALSYSPDRSPSQVLAAARQYAALLEERVRPLPPPANSRQEDRTLRVGLVSAELRQHPVGYFLQALLCEHNRRQIEFYLYANQGPGDGLTEEFRAAVPRWRDIGGRADQAVAEQIRADGIDLLIDLSGHTAGNRLPLFALRPAPVQATWLGYFSTTGLSAIDYLIGDRFVTPPDEEEHYVEQIARLPDSYLCFTPPSFPLEVGPLPALASQVVTFGCFNNLAKVTPQVVGAWSEMLRAVPNSRLLLRYRSLADESTRRRLYAQFADQAIGPSRLRFEPGIPRRELLADYGQVDIALDPFPFNGGTTTAEALWMGVPVVTLTGDRFVSHVGESLLHAAGLEDLVTHSQPRYVARGVELAGDLPALARLREKLRPQVLASPMCDGSRYARAFENLVRELWRRWCRG
jgi:predicted O-linked N-acetylglucosamine transferase (SPINDLY family)